MIKNLMTIIKKKKFLGNHSFIIRKKIVFRVGFQKSVRSQDSGGEELTTFFLSSRGNKRTFKHKR